MPGDTVDCNFFTKLMKINVTVWALRCTVCLHTHTDSRTDATSKPLFWVQNAPKSIFPPKLENVDEKDKFSIS